MSIKKRQSQRIISKDPLWDDVPEMGPEGLIATIDDRTLLLEAIKSNIKKTGELTKMTRHSGAVIKCNE